MQLTVKFRSNTFQAVCIESRDTTLKDLDFIRQKHGDAVMSNVEGFVGSLKQNFELPLTEEEARLSGHFYEKADVYCIVDPKAFNDFVVQEVRKEYGNYKIVLKVDTDKVFQYWKESGYPIL